MHRKRWFDGRPTVLHFHREFGFDLLAEWLEDKMSARTRFTVARDPSVGRRGGSWLVYDWQLNEYVSGYDGPMKSSTKRDAQGVAAQLNEDFPFER